MAFAKGTVVWLKSGGPPMTVEGDDGIGGVVCVWFDGNAAKHETFQPESLTDESPDSGDPPLKVYKS